jgi:hypothetical protein
MQLGRYEIESYYVVIGNQTESRQRIVYIGNNGEDYFIERYYGNIRDGYIQSNSSLRNLNYTDIKSHIPGESIVIMDKSMPPKPIIYIYLSTIRSIERDGDLKLIIIDTQVDPITIEFLTVFDCNQTHSMLIYTLENKQDIGLLETDTTPPVIFFKEYFFGEKIKIDGNDHHLGKISTSDSDLFRININLSTYEGPIPISKEDLIYGMIHEIKDNRDGLMTIIEDDVLIYKDTINVSSEVSEIKELGSYIVRFNLIDFGRNRNNSMVIISII